MTYFLFEYAIKATAISGIFFGVYWLLLRHNGRFAANRLYLLLSTFSSLLLPVLKLPFPGEGIFTSGSPYTLRTLQLNQTSAETEAGITAAGAALPQDGWHYLGYGVLVISALLVLRVFWSLVCTLIEINRGLPNHQDIDGYSITKINGNSPAYSFFRWIFISEHAFGDERLLRTLLAHETCHARQRHSLDRLLLECTTAFCWWNPFFHFIKHQLMLNHEYLADEAAVAEVGRQTFAQVLVSQVLDTGNTRIFHHFFQSPIKSRIMMLSKHKSRFVQWIFIPILLVCAALFSAGTTSVAQGTEGKRITVVVDAGHGGEDPGATAGKLKEKDIALALAKAVQDAGKNRNLNLVLTREKDELLVPGNKNESLKRRVEMVNSNNADVTVSLHVATTTDKTTQSSGVLVFVPSTNKATIDESKILASYLLNGLEGGPLPIHTNLQQRQDNIYILDNNPKPAILLEMGFMNNPKDVQVLSSKEKLAELAQRIVSALEAYAAAKR